MEQDTQVVIDVSVDNVQDVVETSNERLVILSFYSGHMPESQKMNQLFAQLMPRYQEQITLAQVDCDTQPQMAQYFQIQSLPTVMLLQKGQTVDGFFGDKTEQEIESLLQKHLPKAWQIKWASAQEKIKQSKVDEAIVLLREAFQEEQHPDLLHDFVAALIMSQGLDEAKNLLHTHQTILSDDMLAQLTLELDEAVQKNQTPNLKKLEKAYAKDMSNIDIASDYAMELDASGQHEQALQVMFLLLKKDRYALNGDVQKNFLAILKKLGNENPVTKSFQRKLYGLMH